MKWTVKTVDNWRRKEVFRHPLGQKAGIHSLDAIYDRPCNRSADVENFPGRKCEAPESLHLPLGIPFMQGHAVHWQWPARLSNYELDLVKSLAEAFSVAYPRYEDFSKLKKAKLS
jgi:hypothetical protein